MIFCDDYTSMLGVYVLFAEDHGLSLCMGEDDMSNEMVIAYLLGLRKYFDGIYAPGICLIVRRNANL